VPLTSSGRRNPATRSRDEAGRRERCEREAYEGRVYWRGLDELPFVEQVRAISLVRIRISYRRMTTG